MEEGGEREFLCRPELCLDQGSLVGFFVPENNSLCLAVWVHLRPRRRVIDGYLELVLREVLCRLGNNGLVPGLLDGRGEVHFLRLAGVRCLDVATDAEDFIRRWHLQQEVCVIRNRHKLGKS